MDDQAENKDNSRLTLDEMFKVVGNQLNARDVRVLKFMFSDILPPEFLSQIRDGFSFLAILEKINKVDESNFKNVENYLRLISRHDLFQFLSLRRRETMKLDPVNEYIEDRDIRKIMTGSRKRLRPSDSNQGSNQDNNQGNNQAPDGNQDNEPTKDSNQSSQVSSQVSSQASTSTTGTTQTPGPSKRTCVAPAAMTGILSPDPASMGDMRTITRVPNRNYQAAKKGRKSRTEPSRRSNRLKQQSADYTSDTGSHDDSDPAPDSARFLPDGTPRVEIDTESGTIKANISDEESARKKLTCDIRLRVRAEYTSHQAALQGYVQSNKPDLVERQFERFMQANTILKSRDLGSIICDIKFSELTYLDAFWRDYINGSLLEALRGVFITEPLKQAVNHEDIKLVVNIDEDDYECGRLKLLKNLQFQDGFLSSDDSKNS